MSPILPAQFVLDEGNEPGFVPVLDLGPRWKELPQVPVRSRGFVLIPGEGLLTDEFLVDAEHQVHIEALRVIEQASDDGLALEVSLEVEGVTRVLALLEFGNHQLYGAASVCRVGLAAFAGTSARLRLRCLPGALGDPRGDWLALLHCVLATSDALPAALARSQQSWRLSNETGHFTGVYDNPAYQPEQRDDGDFVAAIVPLPPAMAVVEIRAADVLGRLAEQRPAPGETPGRYADRLLAHLLQRRFLSFPERLRAHARDDRPVRLLSLCAGEARIEEELVRSAGVPVDLTLLDLNADLLRRAAARMPAVTAVHLWQGAVEDLGAGEPFDAICFVSGLHHVGPLETLLRAVAARLAPAGEFWLIGEAVGRNGSRLWPEAQRVANPLFKSLPERLRRNAYTGRVDTDLPDLDCSSSCFEGVRSQDIPEALARHFIAIEEDRSNCFLWRFVDLAYANNFDLDQDEDLDILRRLVAEEFAFYANGGLGCSLNGVYRSKLATTMPAMRSAAEPSP